MERRAVNVYGVVQGVGFRPFAYDLAHRFGLQGFVKNVAGAVELEVEGRRELIDEFCQALVVEAPALAAIDHIDSRSIDPCGSAGFRIETSEQGAIGEVIVASDAATCDECLAELFDPTDRRYLYPFLNCTQCGPRLTIVSGAPYDRQRTTMRDFTMCEACRAEYEDPRNRRFHAQPIACPHCGPRLTLCDADGRVQTVDDPIAAFTAAICSGRIGAIKGLGGYHLVCDATDEAAVGLLRQRKERDDKPFGVMFREVAAAERHCRISPAERALLTSRQRPIVLLRRRNIAADTAPLSERIAPANPYLGVMLPYTPLHHLLMARAGRALVMTSGNRRDEPIACREPDVFEQLSGVADLYLTHDRGIRVRCDDSVTRIVDRREAIVRRSRGYAPQPLNLPQAAPAHVLAVGGQLKCTFALAAVTHAVVSHHLGDLDHAEAYRAFVRDVDLYEQLFRLSPAVIACDLHPDYASTHYARDRAQHEGLRCIGVQHHHAHIASCMCEHGLTEPTIGVAFDGTGYGTDGAIWGGEILLADYRHCRRLAHLRYVPLPGGDQAVREPWRAGLAHLLEAGCESTPIHAWSTPAVRRAVTHMIERRINSPLTSSAGRLFDAVAAILGLRGLSTFEAQGAIELEALATAVAPDGHYPFDITTPTTEGAPLLLDPRPTVRAIVADMRNGVARARIARRFHDTIAEMICSACIEVRETVASPTVVLSGGVFANALLLRGVTERLQAAGFTVYRHEHVPTNDGGLSLGQAAVVTAVIAAEQSDTPQHVATALPRGAAHDQNTLEASSPT